MEPPHRKEQTLPRLLAILLSLSLLLTPANSAFVALPPSWLGLWPQVRPSTVAHRNAPLLSVEAVKSPIPMTDASIPAQP